MKNMCHPKVGAFAVFCLFSFFSFNLFAQVGIGTTTPNANALLDIDASISPGGLLLPRVALTGTTNVAPLTLHVAGMTVYNTATAGDVTPGYYFNDGSQWVRIAADLPSSDWARGGNAGTVAGTNFLGTTDNVALRIKTNNVDRFDFTSNGRLRSYNNGNAAQPSYSWNGSNAQNMGMYRIGANILGFSTSSNERLRISASEIIFNEQSNDHDFRIESDDQANMFFIDASTNSIGIQTNTPTYNFHMLNAANVGATSMAAFENTGIDGVALSILNNSAINPYNTVGGETNYNGTTYMPAGVYGLSAANVGYGIGTRGSTNSSDGIGVLGNIPTSGTWLGFGGLFIGGLGYVNGIYNLSDERAKKNITKISSALDNIMNIEGVSYNYDMKKFNPNASEDSHTYYGFLAQNVKEFLPFAVTEKVIPFEDGTSDLETPTLSQSKILNVVDYTAIVPVLVEAMKEQQAQIKALQEEIKILKN